MLHCGVQGRSHHGMHADLSFVCNHAGIGPAKPVELVRPSQRRELAGIGGGTPVDQKLREPETPLPAGQRRTQRRIAIAVACIQPRSVVEQYPRRFRGHGHVERRFPSQRWTGCLAGIFHQYCPNGGDVIQQARGVQIHVRAG